jgi:hypothetical protein
MKRSRFGAIIYPPFIDGRYRYDKSPFSIYMSEKSGNIKDEGKHFNTLSSIERRQVLDYIETKGYPLGKTELIQVSADYQIDKKAKEFWHDKQNKIVSRIIESGLINDYHYRDEMNMIYFQDLEQNIQQWPWPFKAKKGMNFMEKR